jgi:hypothetical protein
LPFRSIKPRARLLVLLEGLILEQLVHGELRLAHVERDERIALRQHGAAPGEDAQHARVHRARDDLLHLGDDRARRGDHRLDRARVGHGRPHGAALHGRADEPWQPEQGRDDDGEDGGSGAGAPPAPLLLDDCVDGSIHGLANVQGKRVATRTC